MNTSDRSTTSTIISLLASDEPLLHAEKLAALGRLIAQVTHELNNPLTTARLLTEALDHEPLTPGAEELVHELSRELEHATTIVQDLLLFVHRGPLQTTRLAASDLIRGALADNERRLAANGVSIEFELQEPLPQLDADPQALRRALANLVQNSIHALAHSEGERQLIIRARTSGPDSRPLLLLEIEDSGTGIPAESLPHIFHPFYTTKPIGIGSGLGLTIVREIVESHGGTITAGNAVAGGALFRIGLPALTAEESASYHPNHYDPQPGARPPRTIGLTGSDPMVQAGGLDPLEADRLQVLVIDDEPELQRALRRILEHLGASVTRALDGPTGLRLARDHQFDLILCDLRIPGLHGAELLDQFRDQAPDAVERIVFMTGDTVTLETREFLARSGRPSLIKPFGRSQLKELLDQTRSALALEES